VDFDIKAVDVKKYHDLPVNRGLAGVEVAAFWHENGMSGSGGGRFESVGTFANLPRKARFVSACVAFCRHLSDARWLDGSDDLR
jgi:hypothetical protein